MTLKTTPKQIAHLRELIAESCSLGHCLVTMDADRAEALLDDVERLQSENLALQDALTAGSQSVEGSHVTRREAAEATP